MSNEKKRGRGEDFHAGVHQMKKLSAFLIAHRMQNPNDIKR